MEQDRSVRLRYTLITSMILVISIFHFQTDVTHRYLHEIYQRAYYIPILLSAFWFGPWKGILAALVTSLFYVVHIEMDWTRFPIYSFNQYAEIVLYHVVAIVIGVLSEKERRQRTRLERTSNELAEAYEKLRDTFERLRRSDRLAALGQLSASLAHEIRNPLGSIKGSVEILETEIPSEHPKHEFIQIIKEELRRLNSLVGEFLKFGRPPKPSVKPTSLNALIESTLLVLKKEAEQSGIVITTEFSDSLPDIPLDAGQIRQVLLNVMLNGIQSMEQGGLLSIRSRARDRNWAVVEVTDTGKGVAEEDLERIFDPFYTTRPDGTGLGLSISYQLLKNHGGHLTAQRNPERGLTMRIELPMGSP